MRSALIRRALGKSSARFLHNATARPQSSPARIGSEASVSRCLVLAATVSLGPIGCGYQSFTFKPRLPVGDQYPPNLTEYHAWDSSEGTPFHSRLRPNLFRLRLPSIRGFVAEQDRPDWCWAAAVQAAHEVTGLAGVDQETIVRWIHGDKTPAEDQSATQGEVVRALNGYRFNVAGRPAYMQASEFASWSNGFKDDLTQGWPVIVGMKDSGSTVGHVIVLTDMTYSFGPQGEVVIHRVGAWDPWPGVGRIRLTGRAFGDRIRFAVRIRVYHG